ncbi:MAG: TIGR03915 family putative DNA repair protein [Coprococcus sp.]
MMIFTCKNNFEDMLTCIYDAWDYALTHGHSNVKLMREPISQLSFLDEYMHIDADSEKTKKVVRSVIKSISYEAYVYVYYALLSDEDTLDIIYRFLNIGFKAGKDVTSMFNEPHVMRMMEQKRKVGNEIHYFQEFARFNSVDNKVYVCHLEPKCDVIYMVAMHFADRMPSEHFMIIDENRKYSVIHPANSDMYLTDLSDRELARLSETEKYSDKYRQLWGVFFDTIGIEQRKNEQCQRNMFPVWMRKHAVEFMDRK